MLEKNLLLPPSGNTCTFQTYDKERSHLFCSQFFLITPSKNLLSSKLARRKKLLTLPLDIMCYLLCHGLLLAYQPDNNLLFFQTCKNKGVTYFAPKFRRSTTRIYHLPNLRKGISHLLYPYIL